jgi:cytochrome c-type biogenesis protein
MTVFLPAITALWLSILTSVSPCPLATNLAAVSYVGRGVGRPSRVALAGLLYTLGRIIAYTALAALLVASVLSSPTVSRWLQEHLNQFLGPLLILVGMVLLGLLDFGLSGAGLNDSLRERVDRLGVAGAGLLGIVFALSLSPVSAALYFRSLLPLAVKEESRYLLPAIYGIGTALPVLIFAGLLAFGANRLGAVFQEVTAVEWYIRKITGFVILGIGLYLTLTAVWRIGV